MKHHMEIKGYANPFMMWTDLSFKYIEMIIDSANVVSHRAGLVSIAAPIANDGDRHELSLMVQEKIEASTESVQAVMAYIMTWNRQLGAQTVKHLMALATAMLLPTDHQSIGESWHQQVKLATAMGETASMTIKLPDDIIHLADRGLKPFYSRVTANVKRLAERPA